MTDTVDASGTASTPAGFRAGAVYAGIKTYGEGKLDLGILVSDRPCTAAAVFTRNRLRSAPIDVDVEKLANGRAQAVVVSSGVANSSTGERGIDDARQMARWAAERLDLPEEDVLVSSTGVIGEYLPMAKIEAGIGQVDAVANGGEAFARAIMTTDTRPKHGAVRFGPYTLGGCAKGSGMIHPNMATMLAYLTTDAPVEASFLQEELRAAVDASFNLVSVDGDTSPSDTVILLANGQGGGPPIAVGGPLAEAFRGALRMLCTHLAREIARDGEGATKLITITVSGAATEAEARMLVREISTSYLVKSAIHGADPNWGRIVSVVGRSSVSIVEDAVTVDVCETRVFEHRRPTTFDQAALSRAMRSDEVTIGVSLGAGTGSATGWGCDLTSDYVHINADYHT